MWIEVSSLHSRLVRATDQERAWVVDYLSFDDPDARFKKGPGKVCLFNETSATFPTGLVTMVKKAGEAADEEKARTAFKVDLLDKRVPPCALDPAADLAWLRDYQREGLDRVVERGRGILWHPTGAGKTETAIGIMRALPTRWLFIVHRAGLADQGADRYDMRAREHGTGDPLAGRIGEGSWIEGARVTFATFQTIFAALKDGEARARALLNGHGGLLVDECHVLPAASFWKVIMSCPAYYRVGLSGTPLARGDRRSIYALAALGPIIHRIKPQLLVDRGVLARPHVRMVPVNHTTPYGSWPSAYAGGVVNGSARNSALVKAMAGASKPGLLFVKEIDHGRHLVRALMMAGVNAEFVYGNHSIDYRKSLVKRLVAGHFDVLVCSVVFQEGIDIPELRSVGIGSGGKSVIEALQRLGRGMRVERNAAGEVTKSDFEVYDIFDKGNKWLERHAKARRAAYVAEGFETIVEGEAVKPARAKK
jgi:superfamily II DNA or RNA helicase